MIEFNHWDIYFKHFDVYYELVKSPSFFSAFNIQFIQNLTYCLKCSNTSRNQRQTKLVLDHTHRI